jgi:hypothetical protein
MRIEHARLLRSQPRGSRQPPPLLHYPRARAIPASVIEQVQVAVKGR